MIRSDRLLWRFSLYGFLKNQQYYEPFFMLVLLAKGLSYLEIGLLYSFREICVNLMGVPAGFLADMHGRRRSLVACFAAYVASFAGFAFGTGLPALFGSMFAFAVGESFRSGTHKAMIFHHLRLAGRDAEKAVVYGFTRSWSKTGSAVSSLLSGLLVFCTGNLSQIFLFAIPPYLANMANVATYPAALEGEIGKTSFSVKTAIATMLRETMRCVKHRGLRGIFVESAVLQSMEKTVKGYLQPLMLASASGLALSGTIGEMDPVRRSAVVLGVLYFFLNAVAAWASRSAHRFDAIERRRLPLPWFALAAAGGFVAAGSWLQGRVPGATGIAAVGFLLLVLLANIWRPLLLDRLDDLSDSRYGAAVLSVEAQFGSIAVMVCAPLAGAVADRFGIAGVGMFVMAAALATGFHSYLRKGSGAAVA